jgi:uncharacterized delta-60 repeat protein/uncharacterized repeat protein (TIGR01451 family)
MPLMLQNNKQLRSGARMIRRAVTAVTLSSLLLLLPLSPFVFAVNLGTVGTAVTQNFDTMAATATAALPADFKVDKGTTSSTVRTVGAYSTALSATEQIGGAGLSGTATGAIYNYGSGTTTTGSDRAVGFLGSGSLFNGNLYAKYTNTTGASLTGLRISYDVEKYRTGTNAQFRFQLFYSTTGAAGSWASAGTNFLTSFPADATNAGCNPAPCSTTPVSNQLLSIPATIANNADIYLAWNYSVTTGSTTTNAQGLGIDNISVTPLGGAISSTGTRTTDIQETDDGSFALALQPDGKIVAGGYAVNVAGNRDFALVRYNYDGSLDSTFGEGGKVTTDFSTPGTNDRIWGIALQTDGKIVAVGETYNASFQNSDIALARYNANGTLDTSFNLTGKVITDHGGGSHNPAYAVAISGTNIIVAGTEAVNGNNDFMVARYTSAGVLDPTFGTLGVTTLGFSGGNDVARGVAIQSDGKIVLGGYAGNGGDNDFAVARFTTAGALDTTFVEGAGKTALDIFGTSDDQAFGIAIHPTTQTIVLAGSAYNPSTSNKDFALVRFLPTGALDSNFNAGANSGIKTTDFGGTPDVANSVVINPTTSNILVGGFSRSGVSNDDFALARYTPAGALDTAFDGDGKLTTAISNADDRAYGVGIQFDGKIVAAGFAAVAGISPVTRNFALARYNSNGSLDSTSAPVGNTNLVLSMRDSLNSVVAGDNFTYTLTVLNKSATPATNVVLTDTLPADVSYIGSTPSRGTVSQNGTTVTHTIGTMAVGEEVTLVIQVGTSVAKIVTNTATVTSAETDTNPSNNNASLRTRIIEVLNVTFSPSTVIGGCQNSTGTVTLSGKASTGGVTVTLTSSDPSAASVPASVFVPEGSSTAAFNITTSAVTQTKTPGIKAVLGISNWSRKLTVEPGACPP